MFNEKTMGLLPVCGVSGLVHNVTSTTIAKWSGIMTDKQFQISYKIEGVRVMNVWLPEGTELPHIWNAMTPEHQDEWLYEHEGRSEVSYEDIHHSQAEAVLEVRHLKAVSN
jgi:hypothetical protein